MTDELLKPRVLREVSKAGRPVSCAEVSFALREHISTVRGALETLVADKDVIYANGLYAKPHSGYNPDGDTAA